MMKLRNPRISFEAIQVQNTLFFKELVLAFSKIRDTKAYTGKALDDIGIAAIIKRHTNFKVKFEVDQDRSLNAYVHIPRLDKNNTIVYDHYKPYLTNTDFDKVIANKKLDSVMGTVDLNTGRVGGTFAEIEHTAVIHRGMFDSSVITVEEIAAIFLHEIGHLFTYYEFLGHILTTNVILHASTQAFFGTDEPIRRSYIVHETCKAIDVDVDDVEALIRCDDKETYQTVFIRDKVLSARSSLGTPLYDLTGTEALADQYAMRQGVGRFLATGLDKIMRDSGDSSYHSTAMHVVATLLNVSLFFLFIMPTFGLILLVLFINPAAKTYDPPQARLERMRRELVVTIKDSRTSKLQKDDAVNDIAAIDRVLVGISDKRGLIEMFYTSVLPSGRKQYQQLKFQVDLEKLVSNDLFIAAQKIK